MELQISVQIELSLRRNAVRMFMPPLYLQKDSIPIVRLALSHSLCLVVYLILIFFYTFSLTPLANLCKHGQEQVRHDMCAQTRIFPYTAYG